MKKAPIRRCVGCRAAKEKRALIRVVRSPEGTLSVDARGKMPGRGAYLCPDAECLRRAVKSRALERALGAPVPEEVFESLGKEMKSADA